MKPLLNSNRLLFIYRMLTTVMTPVAIPAAFTAMAVQKKYRRQMPLRLGRLPDLEKIRGRSPVIWIHALSVGEVNAVMPLIRRIHKKISHAGLICSASTATGMAALDKKISGQGTAVTCMPLDLPPVISRVIKGIRPDCFILAETDIWPGFIRHLHKQGIPSLLINGSISSSAASTLYALRQKGVDAAGFLYGGFHTVAMQSTHDLERLASCTYANLPRLIHGGNLKFDISVPVPHGERLNFLMSRFSIQKDDFIFIAGSTHQGEEKLLLDCFAKIKEDIPNIRLIIAPRDTGRAGKIMKTAHSMEICSCLRSHGYTEKTELIILDTLGELAEIYSLGNAVFVGGSLVPTGGHNLFEPAAHGIPVLWGPHIESCRDMAELLESGNGGIMIDSAESLGKEILSLAHNDERRREMGSNAAEITKKHGGAVDRYMKLIETVLYNSGTRADYS